MAPAELAVPPHLKRVVLVRADAPGADERADPGLSDVVAQRMAVLRRQWEWAEKVAASPRRGPRTAARLLAPHGTIALMARLRPRDQREPAPDFAARVAEALSVLASGGAASVLVVADGELIRQAVVVLAGVELPEGRPEPGEMVVTTRDVTGRFRLGRRSSDPPPLRSALEREGLSGPPEARGVEQHVAKLELDLLAS